MDYVTLGRTGLKASVISLGAGGSSRLGFQKSGQEAAVIVKKAVELGINLIDTAEAYGTENVVGAGLQPVKREDIIISTKYSLQKDKVLKRSPWTQPISCWNRRFRIIAGIYDGRV